MNESVRMDVSISSELDTSLLSWSEEVAQMSAQAAITTTHQTPGDEAVGSGTHRAASAPRAVGHTGISGTVNVRGLADGEVPPTFATLPALQVGRGEGKQRGTATNKANTRTAPVQQAAATEVILTPAHAASVSNAPPSPWGNPQLSLPPHLFPHLASTVVPVGQTTSAAADAFPSQQQHHQGQMSLPQHLVIHPFAMPVMAQGGTIVAPNSVAAASAAYMEAATAAPTTGVGTYGQEVSKASRQQTSISSVQASAQPETNQTAPLQQPPLTQKPSSKHPMLQQQPSPQPLTNDLTQQFKAQPPHPFGPQPSACPLPETGVGANGSVSATMMFNPFASVTHTVANSNGFMSMMQQQMGATTSNAATAASQPTSAPQHFPSRKTTSATSSSKSDNSMKITTPTTSSSSSQASSSGHQPPLPPFFLFDAPCELRTNFIQSQRMHGLPITQDSNSYHYGMAVNGFHPQVNAQDNPIIPLSPATAPNAMISGMPVRLVDGRHHRSRKGGTRERNEREQKRAQKITDLIDKLRVSVEKGGWRVEMKSKYHTLTTCADYVKHLIKTTQEKEAAVEQAKLDLTVKECRLREEQGLIESRSDPESVTSSLTASTKGSFNKAPEDSSSGKESSCSGSDDDKKNVSSVNREGDMKQALTKMRLQNVGQSADSSSGEEGGSRRHGIDISLDTMSSSVSEMTDSNRGSSNEGDRKCTERDHEGENPSSGSISSTAAVVRGELGINRPHGHSGLVAKRSHRKRKRQELTSLEPNFELDYEEVFLSSNVPQLIATPTGKIVVWNDFFLKATGLSKEEAEGMTIFSIVQPDKLSNLFEMVGQALKRESEWPASSHNEASSTLERTASTHTETEERRKLSSEQEEKYQALTLPCISLNASRKRVAAVASYNPNPLYMTVTLMSDVDPSKRCFHCMLTDCPGTNGALGSITPELLSLLFQ